MASVMPDLRLPSQLWRYTLQPALLANFIDEFLSGEKQTDIRTQLVTCCFEDYMNETDTCKLQVGILQTR